jgi:hypothetical protein
MKQPNHNQALGAFAILADLQHAAPTVGWRMQIAPTFNAIIYDFEGDQSAAVIDYGDLDDPHEADQFTIRAQALARRPNQETSR